MNKEKVQENRIEQRYMSRDEAALYLSVSVRIIDRWIAERRLPHIRPGRRVLLDRQDLDNFYAGLRSQPTPQQAV